MRHRPGPPPGAPVPSPLRARHRRLLAGLLCLVTVAVCLGYDHWRGDLPAWWRDHGGGIPYVVFWITLAHAVILRPRAILAISVLVTGATCLLEALQLWQPDWLMTFRATRLGAALLGSGFSWADLPPYLLGGVIGHLVVSLITRPGAKRPASAIVALALLASTVSCATPRGEGIGKAATETPTILEAADLVVELRGNASPARLIVSGEILRESPGYPATLRRLFSP
ncbi:DUF2809 domain-containing protein [bacterium]|nr:DUF2809 domain-containing protein [bacterium]